MACNGYKSARVGVNVAVNPIGVLRTVVLSRDAVIMQSAAVFLDAPLL